MNFGIIPTPYKILAGVLAVILLLGGTYIKGSMDGSFKTKAKYELQAAIDQGKINVLNTKLAVNNDKIVTEYVDKWNTIKEKEYVYVDTAKNGVPGQFDVSNGWVHLHDAAAKADNADPTLASDANSSGIKDNQALAVVVSNYAQCTQYINQLSSLQNWISTQQKEVEAANKK
jgi:hypothetical protein